MNTEFVDDARIIHQIDPGLVLTPGFIFESDIGIWQVSPHHLRERTHANRRAARIIKGVLRVVGHQNAQEDFRDVVNMDRQTNVIRIRKARRLPARWADDAVLEDELLAALNVMKDSPASKGWPLARKPKLVLLHSSDGVPDPFNLEQLRLRQGSRVVLVPRFGLLRVTRGGPWTISESTGLTTP